MIFEYGNSDLDEKVFRNSNVANIVVFIIFSLLIIGCSYIFIAEGYYRNGSVWSYLIYLWFVFWLGIFVWSAGSRVRSCLLPTNWLVKSSSNRILVKYRSFQNLNYAKTDSIIIELPWRDIDWARKTKETSSKASSDGTVTEFFTYLDLKLNLSEEELKEIKASLIKERNRKPPRSEVSELRHELFKARKNKADKNEIQEIKDKIRQEKEINKANKASQKKSGVKFNDYPVRLIENGILRVRWNGIKPKIAKALESIALRTSIESEIKIDSDSTIDLSKGKELDDMILDRVSKGDRFDAMALLQKHHGYSSTEAKQFIDELTDN